MILPALKGDKSLRMGNAHAMMYMNPEPCKGVIKNLIGYIFVIIFARFAQKCRQKNTDMFLFATGYRPLLQ